MLLCDSNVWLALALSKHAHHAAACAWFEAVKEPASMCFCRATQQTLLRLLTNASVLSPYGNPPLTNRQAWEAYEALLGDDRVVLRAEGTGRAGDSLGAFRRVRYCLAQALDGCLLGRLCARRRVSNGDDRRRFQAVPGVGSRAAR